MTSSRSKKIFIVAGLVLLFFTIGSAIRELSPYDEAGIGAAIGWPAIVALFGMFWIADNWKDAITAAFAVTYFIFLAGVLSMSVFSGDGLALDTGTEAVLDGFAGLVSVVLLGYFGQEAVRAGAEAYRQTHLPTEPGLPGRREDPPAARPVIDSNAVHDAPSRDPGTSVP